MQVTYKSRLGLPHYLDPQEVKEELTELIINQTIFFPGSNNQRRKALEFAPSEVCKLLARVIDKLAEKGLLDAKEITELLCPEDCQDLEFVKKVDKK